MRHAREPNRGVGAPFDGREMEGGVLAGTSDTWHLLDLLELELIARESAVREAARERDGRTRETRKDTCP